MSTKSKEVKNELLDSIVILKSAAKDWPQGYANGPIRVSLEKMEHAMQDELVKILNQQRRKGEPARPSKKDSAK